MSGLAMVKGKISYSGKFALSFGQALCYYSGTYSYKLTLRGEMATQKNYPLYQAMIHSLLALAASNGWRVVAEKEIQHGHQIVVTNGKTQNNVDIFPSGKSLVQGQKGVLQDKLFHWRDEWKNSPQKMLATANTQSDLIEKLETPALFAEAQPATTGKTVEEYITNYAQVAIGVAGADDYFGPLVVSALSIDPWVEAQLVMLGDLNTLSNEQIIVVAENIRAIAPHTVAVISNNNYNESFRKLPDKNKLLAWSYARVIEQLCETVSSRTIFSRNFGDESIIQNALTKKNYHVTLRKIIGPNNTGLLAASILARATFLQRLAVLSTHVGISLLEGPANSSTLKIESDIVAKGGQELLAQVAKLSLRASEKVLHGK